MNVVFMGTPDFAVASLAGLVKGGVNVVAVVTAPDKPAGRGQQLRQSAVKTFAVDNGIDVLQPTNLKSEEFIQQLRMLNVDLNVVVAFRMLPESVWQLPSKGTINLHASLLPQYRGAAPINWAIINGENKTGVTTFFIQKEIDTGAIIDQKEIDILSYETAGTLHDKLMSSGAGLLLKTVLNIEKGTASSIPQEDFKEKELKDAPKIFRQDCKINWNESVDVIYNKIRGLSPYPSAWTELNNGKTITVKLYTVEKEIHEHSKTIGSIETDGKQYLKAFCKGGSIKVLELQIAGKKKMSTQDLLRGFELSKEATFN